MHSISPLSDTEESTTDRESSSSSVDFTLPFMPEHLTHLFHTRVYDSLPSEDRLRYNQLQALYFHEQTIFFEVFLVRFIASVEQTRGVTPELAFKLRRFQKDEGMHSRMFRRINAKAAPEFYGDNDFHFIQIPRALSHFVRFTTKFPRFFPAYLLLMLIQEERSLYYGGEFLRIRNRLEPHFVKAQKIHVTDEESHVDIDCELIDLLWHENSPLIRKANAALFSWAIKEFFGAPKRAGMKVVEALCMERPHLLPQLAEMKRQLMGLADDRGFHEKLYSRAIVPRSMALFDKCSEFEQLEHYMPGYSRRGHDRHV